MTNVCRMWDRGSLPIKEKYLNILAIGITVLVQTAECQPGQVSTPWSSVHWVKEEAEMEVTQLTGC